MSEEFKNEDINTKAEAQTEKTPEEKPLDKMTAPELREVAKAIPGVTGTSAMKKDQLLKTIKEYRGIKDEVPQKTSKKKTVQVALSPKDLKKKVILLREEKKMAQDTKDKKKSEILRRRINILKKKTRKAAQA